MVDRNKLNQMAGDKTTAAAGNGQIDGALKMIIDLPKVDSSGENTRAWVVRLIVSVFAVVALYVLYLAYAESAQLRTREAQLAAIEESAQKARAEHAQLTESIAGMREESTSLSASVGKLTQENNQLSYDLQNAQKTITLAEQRQIELDDASTRLATMSAEVSAATNRSATVTREVQGLEARYQAEQENLDSILKSITEHSQTLTEQQPLVDEVNRLKPEREALRKEVERLQITESKLMPLTIQVAELEDRKNRIEPTVARLEISLKAAKIEFDNVRSQLAGEKKSLDETRRQRATIEGEVAGQTKEVATNQATLEKAKSQLAVTLAGIKNQELLKERLIADVSALQAQFEKVTDSIATRESDVQSLKAEVESMRQQKNALVSEISFAQGQLSIAQETKSPAIKSN